MGRDSLGRGRRGVEEFDEFGGHIAHFLEYLEYRVEERRGVKSREREDEQRKVEE